MSTLPGSKGRDLLLSTTKRRRERLEMEELDKESRLALECPIQELCLEDPKAYELEEGEERSFIEKSSENSDIVVSLKQKLLEWVNSVLCDKRVIVRDVQEDFCDGQILQMLLEKLAGMKLDHPEVTQSEVAQLNRLRSILKIVNNILRIPESLASESWTAEKIHNKDLIAILRLLVAIAREFKPTMHIQPGIFLTLIVARKLNGSLEYRYKREYVTASDESLNPRDVTSENLMVTKALISFANNHLNQLRFQVKDLSKDLSDGVLFILLLGHMGGYFVPFYAYHPTPTTESMRIDNIKFVFDLMESAGMTKPPIEPDDVVAGGEDAIVHLLYAIYSQRSNPEENGVSQC